MTKNVLTSWHTGISQRLLHTISPSEHSQYLQLSEDGMGSEGWNNRYNTCYPYLCLIPYILGFVFRMSQNIRNRLNILTSFICATHVLQVLWRVLKKVSKCNSKQYRVYFFSNYIKHTLSASIVVDIWKVSPVLGNNSTWL